GEPHAARLEMGECGRDVLHAQRDVVDPRAALLEVPRDRRVGRGGLEQLQRRLPHRDEMRADALRRDLFRLLDFETEYVTVKGERRVQVLDGNADVIEYCLHGFSARFMIADAAE